MKRNCAMCVVIVALIGLSVAEESDFRKVKVADAKRKAGRR